MLSNVGFSPGPIDGLFGNLTEGAVTDFQRYAKISVDGIAGPQTYNALVDHGALGITTPPPPTKEEIIASRSQVLNSEAGSKPSSGSSVKTLVSNLEKLEKDTKKYLTFDSIGRINNYSLEFIRSSTYVGGQWNKAAGKINDKYITYIDKNDKKVANFFDSTGKGAILKDPVTGKDIDFIHLSATLDVYTSYTYVPGFLGGWGGDMQSAVRNLVDVTKDSNKSSVLNSTAKNYNFSTSDILADIDAANMSQMMKHTNASFSSIVETYYSKNGGAYNRFSIFVESFGGEWAFKKAVNLAMDIPTNLKNSKKYGKPTVKQEDAIANAFADYIISQARKE